MRENLATLYAAVEEGFASPLPAFVKDELEGYLVCRVLNGGARYGKVCSQTHGHCRCWRLTAASAVTNAANT